MNRVTGSIERTIGAKEQQAVSNGEQGIRFEAIEGNYTSRVCEFCIRNAELCIRNDEFCMMSLLVLTEDSRDM